MSEQKISTGSTPEVVIEEVGGNLQVKGWERPEVRAQADPHNLRIEEQDDRVQIRCTSDCTVRLPMTATLQIQRAHGNAQVRLLDDTLNIDSVYGSLYLRNVAEAVIGKVSGELNARQIAGDLKIDQVSGNAMLKDIQGQCLIEQVMGNLDLQDVDGDIRVTVDGNARLRLSALTGSQYKIAAEGNVHLRLPEDADLRLNLSSDGEEILVKLSSGTQVYREAEKELVLGGGTATMEISAGGTIYLSARESGWSEGEEPASGFERLPDDFGEQIARQIEAQIEAQMEVLSAQMTNLEERISRSGMSQEEIDRIMQRARESSERANARAQEKVRRAQEKLERKLEYERRRQEQHAQNGERWGMRSGRHGVHINFPPTPPPPPKEPVSEEERLTILRMLEQKKITLQEAEQLLNALEGKQD